MEKADEKTKMGKNTEDGLPRLSFKKDNPSIIRTMS
jgi:hypothetical protein